MNPLCPSCLETKEKLEHEISTLKAINAEVGLSDRGIYVLETFETALIMLMQSDTDTCEDVQ